MSLLAWVAAPFAAKKKAATPKRAANEVNMSNMKAKAPEIKLAAVSTMPRGVRYLGIIEMSPEDWAKVEDNPRQRDTASRAKRANHLMVPHPIHEHVQMACLPGGRNIKGDGHTRSYLWERKTVIAPARVFAHSWECPDIGAAKELYSLFDNQDAVERVTDKMFGGSNELGLSFESDVLKQLRYANALRMAFELLHGQAKSRSQTVYDLLQYWTSELRLFDQCGPTRKRFQSGVITGALVTFRRFGPKALAFWNDYAAGNGSKLDGEMDAVQALLERLAREKTTGGREDIQRCVRIILSAFDRYMAGETYSVNGSGIKALGGNSLKEWMRRAASAVRTW